MNDECILSVGPEGDACAICGNGPDRLVDCAESEFEDALVKKASKLEPALRSSALRRRFGVVLLSRFHEQVQLLDTLNASPLEQKLWVGFLANGLARYFDPQVEVYDSQGNYIVRVDFASTLLRFAVFTDGHTYHGSAEDQARDAEHNRRLRAEGWIVRRYWTEAIFDHHDDTLDELYSLTAKRIWEMHVAMDAWVP